VMVSTCNLSTQEAKAGGWQVWGWPGLHTEFLSQTNKQQQKEFYKGYWWIDVQREIQDKRCEAPVLSLGKATSKTSPPSTLPQHVLEALRISPLGALWRLHYVGVIGGWRHSKCKKLWVQTPVTRKRKTKAICRCGCWIIGHWWSI
jgi:hypothetical protein